MHNDSAQELRAEVARQRVRLYQLAAQIGMHPGRLGLMLNERLPMRPALAAKIREALDARPREHAD